jgi:hypothetical protein
MEGYQGSMPATRLNAKGASGMLVAGAANAQRRLPASLPGHVAARLSGNGAPTSQTPGSWRSLVLMPAWRKNA